MSRKKVDRDTALQRELRTTSDDVLTTVQRLDELERRKRHLLPGSAEFRELAREIEALAAQVSATTARETDLAEDVADLPPGRAATTPLERVDTSEGPSRQGDA